MYDEGRISAAWVAFGRDAFERAKQHQEREGVTEQLSFRRQKARDSRVNTSLLLMKIGCCLVVEGSHSYKVHLFHADDENAPKLFELQYDCEKIRHLPNVLKSITHYASGAWRDEVLELLAYYQ